MTMHEDDVVDGECVATQIEKALVPKFKRGEWVLADRGEKQEGVIVGMALDYADPNHGRHTLFKIEFQHWYGKRTRWYRGYELHPIQPNMNAVPEF